MGSTWPTAPTARRFRLNKRGDVEGAARGLRSASAMMAGYVMAAPALAAEVDDLEANERQMLARAWAPAQSKETYARAQRRASGKRDLRGTPGTPPPAMPGTPPTAAPGATQPQVAPPTGTARNAPGKTPRVGSPRASGPAAKKPKRS